MYIITMTVLVILQCSILNSLYGALDVLVQLGN